MFRIALQMLMGDKAKYIGLLSGITFTAFLVTFALAYFAGFMTQGFALISENPSVDIWVMDPAVNSTEMTINLPSSALNKVRGVKGVANALPISLNDVTARFANGRFQTFQMIGVDDSSLTGAPLLNGSLPTELYKPDSVIVDSGGTEGKLLTPNLTKDKWSFDGVHLDAPTRQLQTDDELLINDKRIVVVGVSHTIPRFPPRPLLYTTYANVKRILPSDNKTMTFIMVTAQKGIDSRKLADRIEKQTHLRARTSADFKSDTVFWFLVNSEDVGDMGAMLILAMTVGFGVTGIMLYMFTYENLKQYAVLKAMGASNGLLLKMVFIQAVSSAFLGTGIGIGLCAIVGNFITFIEFPYRLMWFTPFVGVLGVLIVSLTAAMVSTRPVLKLDSSIVFSGR